MKKLPYKQWLREVNYYTSIALEMDRGRLERLGWKFKDYYDQGLDPLAMYNIIYERYRLDD